MPRGEFDRSARNAQTRERLLAAAARVYARSGVGGATLDDVAAEAGFTKGAVYSQFGSKENLLVALLHEHLVAQIAAQIEYFDRERATWERPLAGSDRWIEQVDSDPDSFGLFIELWVHAQRDPALRERLATGLRALQATFVRFARDSAADIGLELDERTSDGFAAAVVGLSIGLPIVRLIDPELVPAPLLGAVIATLIRGAERDPAVRELLAALDRPEASSESRGH